MSYELKPVTMDPAAPLWAQSAAAESQADTDHVYLQAVGHFQTGAANWVESETKSRQDSPNPAAYVPKPFTLPIPAREIWGAFPNGLTKVIRTDVDPSLAIPKLPPYVAPPTPATIGTSAPVEDEARAAFEQRVIVEQMRQGKLLDRIVAKLGA